MRVPVFAPLRRGKACCVSGKAEFARDDFVAEVTFADEQGHDEHARRRNFGQDFFDLRFLFPERLADGGENFPAAQFRRVLVNRRGGTVILHRTMAEHHQCGLGEIFTVHTARLAH